MKPSETVSGSVERQLFFRALEKPAGEARAAFLDGACVDYPDLRRRLETLLQKSDSLGTFLEAPAVSAPDSLHRLIAGDDASADIGPAEAFTEKAGDRIDRYKLLQKIGEGGCGVVYMAEQEEPVRRRVALKVIKLGMDTRNVIARFEAERQALALMDHPNIAKVLDAGATATGRPYFVMELVGGIKVTDYCDQNHLTTGQRLELFVQICRAIQHAHQKGIIHRDIKPSNILVTLHDGVPTPKVIDFGIAKATTKQRLTDKTLFTQFEQFLGTPAYMSPEQAEMGGLDIDTRTDIYSLGVLLYELLTGKTPFDSEELLAAGLDEMRRTIREKEPVRPSTRVSTLLAGELTTTAKRRAAEAPKLVHAIRGDLDWIVLKALEKDRTRRYDTVNGLALDLQRHLTNEPVIARPPSRLYRLHKLVRRNKLAFAAAVAVAAALVAGIGVSTWQAIEARKAQRESETARNNEHQQRLEAERQRLAAEASAAGEREQRSRVEDMAYATDMNLTLQALELNNLGRAQELLNRNRPGKGQPDRRGWEWRYLWNRSRSDEIATLGSHDHHVTTLAFCPVGDLLVSGGLDGKIRLWNWKERRPAGELVIGDRVQGVAFSPDGRWLAVNRMGRGCQLWDFAAKCQVAEFKDPELDSAVVDIQGPVAFSARGDILAMSTVGGKILLFNLDTRSLVGTLSDHNNALAFSRDPGSLYSAAENVRIWDLSSQREVTSLKGPTGGIHSITLAPDGSLLAASGCHGTVGVVQIWDLKLQREKLRLTNNALYVWDTKFSPDGRLLATCGADQRIRLFDTAAWQQVQVLKGHVNEVWCLAFSPDGTVLASGGKDDSVRLWHVPPSQATPGVPVRPSRNFNTEPSLSLGGGWFSTLAGNRLTIGDTHSLRDVREVVLESQSGSNVNFTASLLDSVAQRLYLGYANGRVRVLDPVTARDLIALAGHKGEVSLLALSPDGARLASAARDRTVRVQETSTGQPIVALTGADVALDCLCFSGAGTLLAGGSQLNPEILVWDLGTGALRFRMTGHKDQIAGLQFSPDGRLLASASWDGTAQLWDLAIGQRLATLRGHLVGVNAVAFSSDGHRLAGGTGDGFIKLWNVLDHQEVLTLSGQQQIDAVAFLPGDETLVTVGPNFIQLWPAPSLKDIDELERRVQRTR